MGTFIYVVVVSKYAKKPGGDTLLCFVVYSNISIYIWMCVYFEIEYVGKEILAIFSHHK